MDLVSETTDELGVCDDWSHKSLEATWKSLDDWKLVISNAYETSIGDDVDLVEGHVVKVGGFAGFYSIRWDDTTWLTNRVTGGSWQYRVEDGVPCLLLACTVQFLKQPTCEDHAECASFLIQGMFNALGYLIGMDVMKTNRIHAEDLERVMAMTSRTILQHHSNVIVIRQGPDKRTKITEVYDADGELVHRVVSHS